MKIHVSGAQGFHDFDLPGTVLHAHLNVSPTVEPNTLDFLVAGKAFVENASIQAEVVCAHEVDNIAN